MKHFRLLILSLGLALVSLAAAARQVTVSGVVTDASGSALVGATVLVQGGSQGVTTDNKGQFTLNVPEGSVLDISFVGYEKQSVPVKTGAPMHITLQEEATQMGEVVVVGYGVQKKVNLTGAVSQILGDAIADKAAPNVLASLQGELPGVVVTQSSGQPGEEGFALQIRGHSSVNTISTLVLIDGIEGDLDMLNPNDIESISVLKDAASASIYGSKAAAGVILVTTKQGAAERVKVSYNGSYSFTRQGRKPSRINSWEEYEITQRANNKAVNAEMIEWLKNPNFNSMLSSSTALSYLDNTDWIRKSLTTTGAICNVIRCRYAAEAISSTTWPRWGITNAGVSSSTVPMTTTVSTFVRISFRASTAISIFRSSSRPTVRKSTPMPSTLRRCSPKCTAAALACRSIFRRMRIRL